MAEFLQIPYGDVVLAALVPAILYYVALFIQADLEAARAGITRVPENEIPRARAVLAGLHFALPFVVLLVALFTYNAPPETAALYAAVSVVALALIFGYRGRRPALGPILATLRETGLAALDIILIGAAAGIVIGVLSVTGLGFNLTLALVQIGGSNLPLLLILSALVCIVLGMGLPTVGVYVLLAALVAPALVKVGINPIAAHLYVMYFGMMSMITPPVAIAAYAAAGLAQADPVRTGIEAVRFGWSAYIVPFLFVASPSLILIGDTASIAQAVFTAVVGVWVASVGVVGYLVRPLSPPMRAVFFILGVMALIPANAFDGAVYTDIVGVFGGLLLIAREFLVARGLRRRGAAVAPARQP
jgi:TRAP transporter 4TM/12TM fusion protein